MSNAYTGLAMVVRSLNAQAASGLSKTEGNTWLDGGNLWSWLALVSQEDCALAERVRQIFLRNCPNVAAKLIDEIRKDLWARSLVG